MAESLFNQDCIEFAHFETLPATRAQIVHNVMHLALRPDDRLFRALDITEVTAVAGNRIHGESPHIQAHPGSAGPVENMLFQFFPE